MRILLADRGWSGTYFKRYTNEKLAATRENVSSIIFMAYPIELKSALISEVFGHILRPHCCAVQK